MTVLASASSDAAPGTLAFLIVFGMAVIMVFLFRSMSKHLRKVNEAARQDAIAQASAPPPGSNAGTGPDRTLGTRDGADRGAGSLAADPEVHRGVPPD